MLKKDTNTNNIKLNNLELEDFLYNQYITLYLEKKALDAKFKELRATCLKLDNKDRFFHTVKTYNFEAEDVKKLPVELLKINDAELRKIYNSALGGENFLNKYNLKVEVKENLTFKPRKKGEEN